MVQGGNCWVITLFQSIEVTTVDFPMILILRGGRWYMPATNW